MTAGKNRRLSRSGRKGIKKKVSDPFLKKDWYRLRVPNAFDCGFAGYTLVSRYNGPVAVEASLLGREFEASLGDLCKNSEDMAFRKFRFKVQSVRGNDCLTNFRGMTLTSDKIPSLVRKGCSIVECNVNCKTTDGYHLRVFVFSTSKRVPGQVKKTAYVRTSTMKEIRRRMTDVVKDEVECTDLNGVFTKLIKNDQIGYEIEKACDGLFNYGSILIRKVKVIKTPLTVDSGQLSALYGLDDNEDEGAEIDEEL